MGPERAKKGRRHSRVAQRVSSGQRRKERYPLATIAYYGPHDKAPTKIAVGIFEGEGAHPIVERWRGPDVATKPQVAAEIDAYLKAHNVQQVAMTDGIIGCPHEEGIDFPAGQECPYCPFWRGKQGVNVR